MPFIVRKQKDVLWRVIANDLNAIVSEASIEKLGSQSTSD